MDTAVPNVTLSPQKLTPIDIAIKAFQFWQLHPTDAQIDQRLMSYLQQKGIQPEEIPSLIKDATPIYEKLCTSVRSDLSKTPLPQYTQRPRLPDPEPFDGTRSNYPVFKQKANAKIEIDGPIYESERGKVNYLFNRLIGTAAKTALAWLSIQNDPTTASFWTFMDSRFSDPQAKAKALDKLQSMKQKPNEDVRDYLARFEQQLLESEVFMDNAVKISTFTRGLKPHIQRNIAMVNTDTDFESYCGAVIRIQDAHRRINFLSGAPLTTKPIFTAQSDQMAMDWEPTRANAAQPLANSNRRAKWVSQEEVQRRKSNHLCIRCGASGHMISACQYAPARRPASHVSAATAHVEEPQLEDEELLSGKE